MEYIETAEEFANYLRFKHNTDFYDGKVYDSEYIKKVKLGLEELGYEGTRDFIGIEKFIIPRLIKEILPILEEEKAIFIKENIAFGILNSSSVNATIYRNDHNKFAIMFRMGLMTFLNKYFKLLVALRNMDWITFCDRKDASELTKDDIIGYLDELFENTRLYNRPQGVKILLNKEGREHQAVLLYLSETFIICHELGHYLNGDLEMEEAFQMISGEERKISKLSIKHEREYNADYSGFELMLKVLKKRGNDATMSLIFPALLNLFQGLQKISKEETTHPEPLKRLFVLGYLVLGEEKANALGNCMYENDCNLFYKLIENQ